MFDPVVRDLERLVWRLEASLAAETVDTLVAATEHFNIDQEESGAFEDCERDVSDEALQVYEDHVFLEVSGGVQAYTLPVIKKALCIARLRAQALALHVLHGCYSSIAFSTMAAQPCVEDGVIALDPVRASDCDNHCVPQHPILKRPKRYHRREQFEGSTFPGLDHYFAHRPLEFRRPVWRVVHQTPQVRVESQPCFSSVGRLEDRPMLCRLIRNPLYRIRYRPHLLPRLRPIRVLLRRRFSGGIVAHAWSVRFLTLLMCVVPLTRTMAHHTSFEEPPSLAC
mmetsp:Transcript_53495/g.174092  ORF Transcript_53495/g.174092 Transcript_53495/m.174092 type:complete len:282 (-) Transcript_53495:625-1470(-)